MYEPEGWHLFTPPDEDAPRRLARQRELGLGQRAEARFDDFARHVALSAKTPIAFVNFPGNRQQYLAGLHAPLLVPGGPDGRPAPDHPIRGMISWEESFCPHVLARRLCLVLDDVCDYPRFVGNPIVDRYNVRSYLGAPLIDETGTVLGTVCVVDMEPRSWGRAGLEFIKARAAEAIDLIGAPSSDP